MKVKRYEVIWGRSLSYANRLTIICDNNDEAIKVAESIFAGYRYGGDCGFCYVKGEDFYKQIAE